MKRWCMAAGRRDKSYPKSVRTERSWAIPQHLQYYHLVAEGCSELFSEKIIK